MPQRQLLTSFEFLGEALSRLGAAFAQAEEQARQSVNRAELASAALAQEVSGMQAQSQEHLTGTVRAVAEAEKTHTEAAGLVVSAEAVCRGLRAVQMQASAQVDTWLDALERARARVQAGRYEMAQAQGALAAAKALVVARENEHSSASVRVLRQGALQSPLPGAEPASHLEEAAAAREQARSQLRFAMGRLKALQEQVALFERNLTRCKAGAERSVELARTAWESVQRSSAAVALARESASLAEAALKQLLRGRPGIQNCARCAQEAGEAAAALLSEVARSAALAREVSESQAERQVLYGRGVVALEDARYELLQRAASTGAAPKV